MCEVRHIRDRIKTWELLIALRDIPVENLERITVRLAALDECQTKLVERYNTLLEDMQKECEDVERIPMDSGTT